VRGASEGGAATSDGAAIGGTAATVASLGGSLEQAVASSVTTRGTTARMDMPHYPLWGLSPL